MMKFAALISCDRKLNYFIFQNKASGNCDGSFFYYFVTFYRPNYDWVNWENNRCSPRRHWLIPSFLSKSQPKCCEESSPSLWLMMKSEHPASLPTQTGAPLKSSTMLKENQKSQNRNVLCCIVEVKQYYCLSYRMWKGVISCVVPVLIYLQDSHSILSSLNKGPYSVCLSLHCHSPPSTAPQAPV